MISATLDAPDQFRRDQVWFVGKNCKQAPALTSLTESGLRKSEDPDRGYLFEGCKTEPKTVGDADYASCLDVVGTGSGNRPCRPRSGLQA